MNYFSICNYCSCKDMFLENKINVFCGSSVSIHVPCPSHVDLGQYLAFDRRLAHSRANTLMLSDSKLLEPWWFGGKMAGDPTKSSSISSIYSSISSDVHNSQTQINHGQSKSCGKCFVFSSGICCCWAQSIFVALTFLWMVNFERPLLTEFGDTFPDH